MPAAIWRKLGFASSEVWIENLQYLYDDGYSQAGLATIFGCDITCIENWFKRGGLQTRTLQEASKNFHEKSVDFSLDEISILEGLLLSDGNLEAGSVGARLTYGFKHIECVKSIPRNFQQLDFSPVWFSKKWRCWHQKSLRYKELLYEHNRWYGAEGKQVPRDFVLTPKSAYWWYIGDGGVTSYGLELSTNSFNQESIDILLKQLMRNEIDASHMPSSNTIRILSNSVNRFYQYIGSSKHKCFNYKWIPKNKKEGGAWVCEMDEDRIMKKSIAVITGILGQTGSYMAELLLEKGYIVYGLCRPRSGGLILDNIKEIVDHPDLELVELDLTDHVQMAALISSLKPDMFLNFAAQSHVGVSFSNPASTFEINANSTISQLHAIKEFSPKTKYYFAATSEMFGGVDCPTEGYDETSPLKPRSPYAISKVAGFHAVENYREAYGLFACSGILFNHESPRRGVTFVTRKITSGIADIKKGKADKIRLGNLESFRDFGHAKDYCKAIWLMMNAEQPKDYVVATGATVKIIDVLRYVCELAGLDIDEVYEIDERFMRPSDVPYLIGNSTKIREELGWEPEYDWKSLLKEMYENDLRLLGDKQ